MPKVSVVIPCYNHGKYVREAVESVLNQTYQDFEIIIVNDGSTDKFTNNLLKNYEIPKTRIIHTDNQGLASARNNGIREAKGEYILPLDADDKIGNEYLEEAVKILDINPGIGIVYSKAKTFGAVEKEWELPEYSLEKMLLDNIIFCSAFFRKKDWKKVGGYDPEMIYGWEDYNFWLSLIERGVLVYKIPKVLFYYRTFEDSMVRSKTKDQKVEMFVKIFQNHRELFGKNIRVLIDKILIDQEYVAQLYIDTGFGFNEKQLLTQTIISHERNIAFDLSDYVGIKSLRFDPINDYAVIHINSIVIIDENNSSYKIDNYDNNALKLDTNNLIFATNDPQIFLLNLPQNKIHKLIINLEFVAIGKDSFHYILKYKDEQIKDYQNLLNSRSWKLTAPFGLISKYTKKLLERFLL